MIAKGSCLCEKVGFEIDGEFNSFFLCHCTHCKKDTGSAYASNLFCSDAKLMWKSGKELVRTYNLPSTAHMKSFCEICGSALPFEQKELNMIVVPAGSLDNEVAIKPTAHIFQASEANWEKSLDNIHKFDSFPT